jgi:DNA repair protein RadC
VIKYLISDLAAKASERAAFDFHDKPELPEFENTGRVEWNSSTKALAEYLAALGLAEPAKLARSLLEEFGSISDFLTASRWRLCGQVGPRLARSIKASHSLMRTMLGEQIIEGPVVPRSRALIDFLQAEIGFLKHERLVALYVDWKCKLMRVERIADGSFAEVQVDNRRVIGCALNIGAAGFILVHNHASGIPKPSKADLDFTSRLKSLAADLDLCLLDHFIVARGQFGTIEDYYREARFSDQDK